MPESNEDFGVPPPTGPPAYGWFDGVLEGKAADPEKLLSIAGEWEKMFRDGPSLDLQGSRFSFMPSDAVLDGSMLGTEQQDAILALLHRIEEEAAAPNTLESTLRCTLVYEDQVVETLFGALEGGLTSVSRSRPVSAADQVRRTRSGIIPESVRSLGLIRGLVVGVLALLLFSLLVWQGGWLDQVRAVPAEELEMDAGTFEGMLVLDVESSLGHYEVRVRRGEEFPVDPEATKLLTEAAEDNLRIASIEVVRSGDFVYLQLVNSKHLEDDKPVTLILQEEKLELRGLLVDQTAEVEARLKGRSTATGCRLSIASGRKKK